MYDMAVAIAAPIGPNFKTKIKFIIMLQTAPTVVVRLSVFPSLTALNMPVKNPESDANRIATR